MSEELILRPLETRDLPEALAIQSAVYPAFLIEPAEAFASRLNVPAQFSLAAVRNGNLVAYLFAHGWLRQSPPPVGAVLTAFAPSEVLLIHDLAVGPDGRGLALGRRLVKRAFELASLQQLARAELIAVEGAASYWKTLGFAEEELSAELRAKIAPYGQSARWMTREISPLMGE